MAVNNLKQRKLKYKPGDVVAIEDAFFDYDGFRHLTGQVFTITGYNEMSGVDYTTENFGVNEEDIACSVTTEENPEYFL